MRKELIYSDLFIETVNQIRIYVAKDSVIKADKFIDKILDKVDNLENFPYLGIKINENLYQYIVNKNYVVYYMILKTNIYVLYVINVKFIERK